MAKVYIQEYQRQARDGMTVSVAAGMEPAVATQTVAIGGASVQSAAFNAKTTFVAINTDQTCSVAFGENPTATTNSFRIPANATMFFGVVPGQKVAVISNT